MNEVEIIRHRQMQSLTLFLNTVEHRTPHCHPEWELLWLLEGTLAVSCGQQCRTLTPGEMVLFAPDEVHEFQKTTGSGTFLCMQLSPELGAGLGETPQWQILQQRYPQDCLSAQKMAELQKGLAAAAGAYFARAPQYRLLCLGQCCLVLHTLLGRLPGRMLTPEEAAATGRRNARLQRFIRFVDENYMHKLRLADFAVQENCSLSYLSHFIRQTTGMTFQEYVTTVRFNSACKLIADTEMRLLDVCVAAGFSDYRYFSRAFRQQYGLTPEEYRRAVPAGVAGAAVRRSLHSVERIYTLEESLQLLQRLYP